MTRAAHYLAAVSAIALMPMQAHAQDMSAEEAAEMRAQISELKAQVEALETRLNTQEAAQAGAPIAPAPAPAAVADENKPAINFKGAPEIKTKDGWSFKPRGRIQYDAVHVSAPDAVNDSGLGFSNELRRIRLGAQGSMPGGFGYKFEVDFADNDIAVADAILTYKNDGTTVSIGHHNNLQSLEELTSSLHISFLERAAFTDAFGFERRAGVSVSQKAGDFILSGGVFTASIDDLTSDEDDSIGLDGRIVYARKFGDTRVHLGGSAHWRDLGDNVQSVRYRQRPAVHATDTRFIATPRLPASSETSFGLEAAVIAGRLHAVGEAHWMQPDLIASTTADPNVLGAADPTFFGGYVEAGIFLTDDTRGYKSGKFDRTKPSSAVGEGGIGAVQFNVRYDRLDLNDNGITGGTQDGYSASLIWTPIDYIRFMLNYNHLVYGDAAIAAGTDRDYSVDSVGVRAQVDF